VSKGSEQRSEYVRLPSVKKKFVAIAAAAGIAVGSGGLAFAFITAPTSSAGGTGHVTAPTPVKVGTAPVVFNRVTTPTFANYTVTNPNTFTVHVGKARVSTVRTTDCTKNDNPLSPLVSNTTGTVTVGTVAPGKITVANTSLRNPTFTLHTTPSFNQSNCKITFKLTV
jgi:hypothetical protein